mgnify:CR=1 FL=1
MGDRDRQDSALHVRTRRAMDRFEQAFVVRSVAGRTLPRAVLGVPAHSMAALFCGRDARNGTRSFEGNARTIGGFADAHRESHGSDDARVKSERQRGSCWRCSACHRVGGSVCRDCSGTASRGSLTGFQSDRRVQNISAGQVVALASPKLALCDTRLALSPRYQRRFLRHLKFAAGLTSKPSAWRASADEFAAIPVSADRRAQVRGSPHGCQCRQPIIGSRKHHRQRVMSEINVTRWST